MRTRCSNSRRALFRLIPLLAALAAACSPHETVRHSNVLLICIDVLRADHVGAYGYDRGTTPHLDRLARSGVVFEHAFSATSWTKPSVPSTMTGRFPHQHGVYLGLRSENGRQVSDVLDDNETTLAEMFHAGGYRTMAVVANPTISASMGIAQGFDRYIELGGEQRASGVREAFLTWLDEPQPQRPFFAYLHFNDVHLPYDPPPAYRPASARRRPDLDFSGASWRVLKRRIRDGSLELASEDRQMVVDLYDGELRYADAEIGVALDGLAQRKLLDDTLVVVISDHGEEFFDHGGIDHGTSLYDELISVPLIFRFPGDRHAGTRVASPASLVDLLPTLAEAFSLPLPERTSTRSLLGLIDARSPAAMQPIYSEGIHPAGYQQALRVGEWKYIVTVATGEGSQEASDPLREFADGARVEVTGAAGVGNEFIADKLEIRRSETTTRDEITGPLESFDRDAGRLRVLGYEVRLEPGGTVEDSRGGVSTMASLEVGVFVKVHGRAKSATEFAATRIAIRDRALPGKYEIEGRIAGAPRRESLRHVAFDVAGRVVKVGPKTKVKVAEEGATAVAGSSTSDPWQRALASGASQRQELYDLNRDPDERNDLSKEQPQKLEELRSRLAVLRQASQAEAAPTRNVDQRDLEAMRSLGYVE